jgi:hypothetical protein
MTETNEFGAGRFRSADWAEAYEALTEDMAERRALARSAFGRVSGGGEVRVRLPSDHLRPGQQSELNGPTRVYDLGRPLSRGEYAGLPDDLKRLYLRLLRDRHGGTEKQIRRLTGAAETFGVRLSGARGDGRRWAAFLALAREAAE